MDQKTARPPLPALVHPEAIYGPAMKALSEPQRAFVNALIETGAEDYTRAAAMAGYGGTEGSRRVSACKLMQNPKVLAAMREEADRRIHGSVLLATAALEEIVRDKQHKDRFKAADRLLERAGLIVETSHRVTVEDNRTTEEIEKRVTELAVKYGLNPKQLLGRVSTGVAEKNNAVDAEFTEVPPEDEEVW